MKIRIKQEPLYPSSTRPGVFFYENGLEDVWETYTGIDDSELNRFKFSIGTWQELSRQNRGIQLLSIEEMDFISLGLSEDTGEPKPTEPPEGFVENTEENAEEFEAKPPSDSKGAGISFGRPNTDGTGGYQPFVHDMGSTPTGTSATITEISDSDGNFGFFRSNVDVDGYEARFLPFAEAMPYLLNRSFKSNDPRMNNDDAKGYWILASVGRKEIGDQGVIEGLIEAGQDTVKSWWNKAKALVTGETYEGYLDETNLNLDDVFIYFNWQPNLNEFATFSKDGTYSDGYEWKWNGTTAKWVRGKTIITEPQLRRPENIYFGFSIISENKPDSYDILNQDGSESDDYYFPVFYPTDSDEYKNTTAPARVWFGINTFQVDTELGSFKLKYHVLEWGDEDIKLTNEQILNSEFFSLYSDDDDTFDRSQAKRLFQTIESSPFHLDEDGEMNLTEHTYTTPGVKNIKTILFRMSSDEKILYETILLNTNVVINDASEYKQDFDLFGAVEFSVLPLKENESELIIGGMSEKSKYVNSLKVIERNDLYGPGDYLEKKYTENTLPNIKESLYGDTITKMDLSTTRLFTKPYDISYFTDRIPTTKRRSRATDILIDNSDCLVELNPDKNDRNIIENTGISNEQAILIGDYEVVKEPNRDMRKKDNMDVPKIETRKENQAF